MKRRSVRLILICASAGLTLFLAWFFLLRPSDHTNVLGVLNNSADAGFSATATAAASDPLHIVITGVETVTPTPLPTKIPTPTAPPKTLDETIADVIKKWNGSLGPNAEFGIVVHNLDTGDRVSINGHKNFETASIYKLFVMTAIYYDISQDNLSLDTPITLTGAAADAEEDGGALIVDIGESLPVRNLLEAMITSSNNTSGLMLLFQVKIPRLKQIISNLGFKESDLSDSYNYQATPEDLDQLLSRLATQKLLGPQYDQQMLDLMSQQKIRDRIPALLPPGTRVANKTGDIDGINNDTGLVFLPNGQRLAITVMVHNSNNFTASRQFISDISLAAYNFYAVTK